MVLHFCMWPQRLIFCCGLGTADMRAGCTSKESSND